MTPPAPLQEPVANLHLGFKEYTEKLKDLLKTRVLLVFSLFIDEYTKSRNDKTKLNALVIRLDVTPNVSETPPSLKSPTFLQLACSDHHV